MIVINYYKLNISLFYFIFKYKWNSKNSLHIQILYTFLLNKLEFIYQY